MDNLSVKLVVSANAVSAKPVVACTNVQMVNDQTFFVSRGTSKDSVTPNNLKPTNIKIKVKDFSDASCASGSSEEILSKSTTPTSSSGTSEESEEKETPAKPDSLANSLLF